jgi:hypothetical protein
MCVGCRKRREEMVEHEKMFGKLLDALVQGTKTAGISGHSTARKYMHEFRMSTPAAVQYSAMVDKWHMCVLLSPLEDDDDEDDDLDEFKKVLPHFISDGTLCLSETAFFFHVPSRFWPSIISTPAAEKIISACDSIGERITCLDVRSNPNLMQLAEELCQIPSLESFECAGCPLLSSPPSEVAENGGVESLRFMRACIQDGAVKESLALFLVGDGEAGKTSVVSALINEETNTADEIGQDTRTVGSLSFSLTCASPCLLSIRPSPVSLPSWGM